MKLLKSIILDFLTTYYFTELGVLIKIIWKPLTHYSVCIINICPCILLLLKLLCSEKVIYTKLLWL